jgi:hypothetical protein
MDQTVTFAHNVSRQLEATVLAVAGENCTCVSNRFDTMANALSLVN